ncbi:hypothetical protein O0I10_010468 [Lichtheimia ornata]|uniref:Attractin/MKLN-like beta-propeller domain-containing protein n=1 Tax=Lichtheimia ornata TaxID=688661 RepID=A0AAD7XV35_9FUNG|nr:uncharacterized protein O0I10_010468 [Lichtheimia ornata]KAJ8653901.1 hypothetical protein O0I10_010468 [Lichtheimia ornata]
MTLCSLLYPLLAIIFFIPKSGFVIASSYAVDQEQLARIPYRYASTSFAREGVLYSYGGVTRDAKATTLFTSISFDPTNGSVIYHNVNQSSNAPYASYAQGVLLNDNNRFILFGGTDNITSTTTTPNTTMRVFEYRFDNQTWRELVVSSNNNQLPLHRMEFTAKLSNNGKVYLYGGTIHNTRTVLGDAWAFNPETGEFSQLTPPSPSYVLSNTSYNGPSTNTGLYGHSAISLPNGIILHLMGNGYYNGTLYDNTVNDTLCNMALLLDTNTHQWRYQPLGGQDMPQQIINGYAALGPDRKTIYLSGGWYGASRTLTRRSVSSNDLSVLNTTSWEWQTPSNVYGDTPKPRFLANAELLLDKYIVVFFGTSEYFWYNDINVLQFGSLANGSFVAQWKNNITTPLLAPIQPMFPGDDSLSSTQKIGIALAVIGIVVFIIILGSWYFGEPVKHLIGRSYYGIIWSIRVGEPLWIGVSHTLTKLALSFMFLAYVIYIVKLVIDSGQSSVDLIEPANHVLLPDIRFCFDGWVDTAVGCETESLSVDDCVSLNYIRRLDMRMHQPYFDYTGAIECHLFHADEYFRLTRAPTIGQQQQCNGSRIQFSFFGTPAEQDTNRFVHVSVYPRGRDPNLDFYYNEEKYMNKQELEKWLYDDSNNLLSSSDKRTSLHFNTSATLSYKLLTHRYLQSSLWNIVGIASAYNSTSEVDATFSPDVQRLLRPGNNPASVNFLDVYPESFVTYTRMEQKLHTLLTSVGSIGGLLSLLITLNSWLWGSRARAPLGWAHRVLWGRRAHMWLLNGLRTKFGNVSDSVPYVHPVESYLLSQQQADWHSIIDLPRDHRTDSSGSSPLEQPTTSSATLQPSDPEMGKKYKFRDSNLTDSSRTQCGDDDADAALGSCNKCFIVAQELEKLQRRVQLNELVMKEYYIDDEVFRNISVAMDIDNKDQQEVSLSRQRSSASSLSSPFGDIRRGSLKKHQSRSMPYIPRIVKPMPSLASLPNDISPSATKSRM